jgi:hypothetical protein
LSSSILLLSRDKLWICSVSREIPYIIS